MSIVADRYVSAGVGQPPELTLRYLYERYTGRLRGTWQKSVLDALFFLTSPRLYQSLAAVLILLTGPVAIAYGPSSGTFAAVCYFFALLLVLAWQALSKAERQILNRAEKIIDHYQWNDAPWECD